ncbi:MAG: hypothetical protein HY537_18455 [Deltaproteobacteria bacterium]|nr:hypothetical protein [Deltaproteobacteria bacterium]
MGRLPYSNYQRAFLHTLFFSLFLFVSNESYGVEFSWNGFGSLYAIQPLQSDIYLTQPETLGHTNFVDGSHLGLNVASDLGAGWSARLQLLASGETLPVGSRPDWKLTADWFYVTYNPFEGLKLSVGRQIFPNWLVSEVIDVGFLYPWRKPPRLVYSIAPFKSFNGLQVEYRHLLGGGLSVIGSLFGGNEKMSATLSDGTEVHIDINNLVGATVVLEGDGWKVRGMLARKEEQGHAATGLFSVSGPIGRPILSDNSAHTIACTLGGRYDKNNIVAYAEGGIKRGSNSTIVANTGQPFLHSQTGGYGSVGYRLGKFLPWLMYAYGDWTLGIAGGNGKAQVKSVGVDYRLADSVVLKAQLDNQISENDTMGLSRTGTANTISVGLDAIF